MFLALTITFSIICRYCLNYVMEHASSPDGYVQSKVSAVAARLLKRGWLVSMFLPTLEVQCLIDLLCLIITCLLAPVYSDFFFIFLLSPEFL